MNQMNDKSEIRVLIAEDDFLVGKEVSRALKMKGYELAGIASNGKMAYEMVSSLKPDAVLMDIKMPVMDGLQAARKIQDHCPTPLVALTAHETQDLIDSVSLNGFGAYLTKPPDPDEIDRAIAIARARHHDLMTSFNLVKDLESSTRELKQKQNELTELNADKDKFLSILSHDLKSPLSGLMGLAELIDQKYDAYPEQTRRDIISDIHSSSRDLYQLLDGLLTWSRLQSGRISFTPTKLLTSDMVSGIIRLFQSTAQKKQIKLVNGSAKNIVLETDRNMILTILRNLVSNAIKFTDEGGTIELITETTEDQAEITVRDTGQGLDPSTLNLILHTETQYSTMGTGGERGTGIGLNIVRELTRVLGGTLRANSEPGKGSAFTVVFPLNKEQTARKDQCATLQV